MDNPADGPADGLAGAELAAVAEELAARFATAEPAEADLLAAAVFGAYGARHLGGAPREAEPAPGTSWWHGPTVHHSTSPLFRPLGYRRIRREAPAQAGCPAHRRRPATANPDAPPPNRSPPPGC